MDCTEYNERLEAIRLQYGLSKENEILVSSLGIAGEAGEVAEIMKKYIRDGNINQADLRKELGDVIAYVVVLASMFDISLEEILIGNIDKLESRSKKGTLRGSGDNR
jgi:NTP pyrophosphatase (non-canonical NTP hydrolase)